MIELKPYRGNKLLFIDEPFDTIVKINRVAVSEQSDLTVGFVDELHFINQDGSKAAICGNALMQYAIDYSIENPKIRCFPIIIERRMMTAYNLKEEGKITVEMPRVKYWNVSKDYYGTSIGNLHSLFFEERDIDTFSEGMRNNSNISLIKILDDTTIFVKTHECGVGLTESCGSAACCAAWVYCKQYLKKPAVITVQQAGGDIDIDCTGETPVMVHKLTEEACG